MYELRLSTSHTCGFIVMFGILCIITLCGGGGDSTVIDGVGSSGFYVDNMFEQTVFGGQLGRHDRRVIKVSAMLK